jgi:branched-chain amino acid transport system substrate-binding protein
LLEPNKPSQSMCSASPNDVVSVASKAKWPGQIDMLRNFTLAAAMAMLTGSAVAQTIRIGLSAPLSGPSLSMGTSMRDGAKLAVSEINQAGGIMGRQVVLVERDDHGQAERGVQAAHELIDNERVVATVGFVNTEVALASQRLYEAAEIPVLNAVAAGTSITHQFEPPEYKANFIFRTSTTDAIQADLIVQEAITHRQFEAPAILADSTREGQAFRADLEKALSAMRMTPAAVETFNIGDTDMTNQLARIKRANADVILVYGVDLELVRIVNSMSVLGWKLPIMGSEALATATFLYNARANSDGASMPQTFIQTGTTEKRAAFVAAYSRTYQVTRFPSPDAAAQSYDSVYLLKAAIEQANSTVGREIRAALENLRTKVVGVVTTYDRPFSPADHEAITANIPVFGVVRNGHVVVAHEEDISGDRAVRVKQ